MPQCLLSVVRCGKQWGVSADGEVMALVRRKRDAKALASETAQTLRESGYHSQVVAVAGEPRSFRSEE